MDLEEQRRARYLAIANVVVLLTGAFVATTGFLLSPAGLEWHSVLINVGSDLIVVSVIFFFGKIMLTDPQRDLEERLDRIQLKLDMQSNVFLTRAQLNSRQSFAEFIREAQDLFLGGTTLRSTARGHRSFFRERLARGARLRFAVVDPESPDVAALAAVWNVSVEDIASSIRATLGELNVLRGIAATEPGSVEVRLLQREPAFSFVLRDPRKPEGVLRADLRAFGLDTALRPGWELRPVDEPWFQRFVQTCERLWEDAEPWPESTEPVTFR